MRITMTRTRAIAICVGFVALASILASPLMSKVEQPSYSVERSDGPFEVRAYPPTIVAQITMRGGRREAIGAGFRLVAGYIFGDNATHQKVAMTAPVLQQRVSGEAVDPAEGTSWTVRFVMPRTWSMTTLPKPADARVTVVAHPAERYAVVRYSGLARGGAIAEKTRALTGYMAEQKLRPAGEPVFAFYDPPWTLPFLRRNEIMIGIAPADAR